jgi:hypothetical protein
MILLKQVLSGDKSNPMKADRERFSEIKVLKMLPFKDKTNA